MSRTLISKLSIAAIAMAPAMLLAGCNSEVGAGQRDQIVQGCVAGAAGSGIAEAQITQICGCAADKSIEQHLTPTEMTGPKAQQIAQECAMETLQAQVGGAAAPAPAAK
jgi:predicted small secreted protein